MHSEPIDEVNAVHLHDDEDLQRLDSFEQFQSALAALECHDVAPGVTGVLTRTLHGTVAMELQLPVGGVRRVPERMDAWDWPDRSAMILTLTHGWFPMSVARSTARTRCLRMHDHLMRLDFTDDPTRLRDHAFVKGALPGNVDVLASVGAATAARLDALLAALQTLRPAGRDALAEELS